ncbi:MAG: M23 family metallopeptidase [Actinomycetota bacterium]
MAADIEPTANTAEKTPATRGRTASTVSARKASLKPLRSIAIFGAVGALVAAVALPAYASTTPVEATATLQQLAVDDAQSLVVASEAAASPMDRGTYSATTPEEIEKKKAEEAAAARAKAAAAAASVASAPSVASDIDLSLVAAGSGAVRYPAPQGSYTVSRTLGGGHNGADMVGAAGTPLFATADGVVRISTENYYGYGVAVVIDHVIGGQRVSTLYAHMIYGSRLVEAGQTVEAGQLIGQMGTTGRSTANHLHYEVRVNDSLVEPISWLQANAS